MRERAVIALAFVLIFFAAAYGGDAPKHGRVRLEVPDKYRSGAFKQARDLYAPEGFKVSVFASDLSSPRMMAFDKAGNLYVSLPSEGKVAVLPDKNKDGVADRIVIFARGLRRPHGLAFTGEGLIVAETGRLSLLKDKDGDLKADSHETLTEGVPGGGGHWTRTVITGPDGSLFVSAGSSCNVCVEDDKKRASVMRVEEGKVEVFATGLRNTVGIAFHPVTKELWGVDNGRDLLGDEVPPEELNKIIKGGDYGWPYCYSDRAPDPELGSPMKCKDTIPPAVKMQAHSAPLGIAFGQGLKFPEEFREVLFVAFHGSWNRTVPTGYKLVAIPFKDGRPSGEPVDFVTGWLVKSKAWGRPVAPVAGPDGALYLSDDHAGAIYRISHE